MAQRSSSTKAQRTLEDLIREQQVITQPPSLVPRGSVGNFPAWVARLIRFAFTILIWLLIVRVGFLFIAANPEQPLVAAVYDLSARFVAPFEDIVDTIKVKDLGIDDWSRSKGVLEASTLVAITIYWIAGRLLASFVQALLGPVDKRPTSATSAPRTANAPRRSNQPDLSGL